MKGKRKNFMKRLLLLLAACGAWVTTAALSYDLPSSAAEARVRLINHYDVPQSTITAFTVDDQPVRRAMIQWKTYATLWDPYGYPYVQWYYHTRVYDFASA